MTCADLVLVCNVDNLVEDVNAQTPHSVSDGQTSVLGELNMLCHTCPLPARELGSPLRNLHHCQSFTQAITRRQN